MKRKPLFTLLFSVFFLSLPSVVSAADELEVRNMEQMMGSIRLEKRQIENMVDKMAVSGRLTQDEVRKVKREIASLKEDDMENLKNTAIAEVKNKRLREH